MLVLLDDLYFVIVKTHKLTCWETIYFACLLLFSPDELASGLQGRKLGLLAIPFGHALRALAM